MLIAASPLLACAKPAGLDPYARVSLLLGQTRPFEARLSGSRQWIQCAADSAISRSARTLGCGNHIVNVKALGDALHLVREEDPAEPSGERQWAANAVDLAASTRVEQLDEIIARFSDIASPSSAVLNDLGVAELTRSVARRDAWGAIDALETIERAASTDSSSLVIRFNRALILERVGLKDGAEAAWRDYARHESDSSWVRESLNHLHRLAARRDQRGFDPSSPDMASEVLLDPQGAREFVTDSLLAAWGRSASEGDRTSRDHLAEMRTIGSAIADRSGDSSAIHIAADCERATTEVAAYVATFARGAATFRRGSYAASERDLAVASRGLRSRQAHAIADWADILVAASNMFRGRYADANRITKQVDRTAAERSDLALKARANWVLGLAAARQERTADAESYTTLAVKLFETLGERGNEAFMRAQLADVDYSLGRDDAWLEQKSAALSQFDRERDVRRRYSVLADLGKQLTDLGRRRAGVVILQEAVTLSNRTGRPSDHVEALIRLAAGQFEVGQVSDGVVALASARDALSDLNDPVMRARLDMEASMAAASAARTNPSEAASYLSKVVHYFDEQDLRFSIARPLTQRAGARLKLRDTVGALSDLKAAVSLSRADDVMDRDGSAARSEAFRLLTAVQAARADTAGALSTVERSRSSRPGRTPLTQPHIVGVTYSVLPDETFMWITNSKRVRMLRLPIGKLELDDLVARFEAQISRHFEQKSTSETARALYKLLISPADNELAFEARVGKVPDLVLSTDGPLARLPFALLQDSAARFLFEKVVVRYSGVATSRQPTTVDRSGVVVVANPNFDPNLFADLAPLRGADLEGAAVAHTYAHPRLLTKAAATKTAFIAALKTATLVHFAGHARLVDRAPRLSHLVTAARDGGYEANIVSAAELAHQDLSHLSLVVLSSCGTTQRHSRLDSGGDGLSQAFLSAGAGAVISSLWAVDDDDVTALMTVLHQRLAAGDPPPAALRLAELRMLENGRRGRAVSVGGIFRVETN